MERQPGQIRTYTGRFVDPLNLRVEDVHINDIAHSLSLQCRYNGHSYGFLSVARHSVWVAEMLRSDPALALWGLLHDAAEAYLGDLVAPLKHGPVLGPVFQHAEDQALKVIAKAFGLVWPMPVAVHEADLAARGEEMEEPLGHRFHWDSTPATDERAFLKRYGSLRDFIKSALVPDVAGRDV